MQFTTVLLYQLLMLFMASQLSRSIRSIKHSHLRRLRRFVQSAAPEFTTEIQNGDVLLTGLNGDQDIIVRAVSCRETIQEMLIRNDLSPQAAKALGEVSVCALMMGAGMKGEEVLQINLVGEGEIKNVMAITDSDLKVRGMVGNSKVNMGKGDSAKTSELFGNGQVQVVRSHPSWKQPTNGIVELRDTSVALNMALYMAESEQRSAVMLTDVKIEGSLCRYALGVMVERLPGAKEENIERSIRNVGLVEQKGLRSYLDRKGGEEVQRAVEGDNLFRDFALPLDAIMDDCMVEMDDGGIRWSKQPRMGCSCGVDKIWRTLQLLPRSEIESIVAEEESISMRCDFCGKSYEVTREEMVARILSPIE